MKTPIAPRVDGVSGDQHIANLFSRKFEGLFNKKCSSSRSDFFSCVLVSLSTLCFRKFPSLKRKFLMLLIS